MKAETLKIITWSGLSVAALSLKLLDHSLFNNHVERKSRVAGTLNDPITCITRKDA